MRSLITGGAGFVGQVLQEYLRAQGDEVIALDRNNGGDVTDRDGITEAFRERRPDVVFHLAAQSHVPTSWEDPIATLRCNVEGTVNVLDAAHAASPTTRVVMASSADVYGAVNVEELPIVEQCSTNPKNPYAASKLAAEAMAMQSFHGRDQDVVRVRAFNHVGPGQSTNFVCAGLAHRIATAERDGLETVETGRLDVRRDFSDVRDVVRAYRLIAEFGATGAVYNVCSGTDRSIEEIALALADRSPQHLQFVARDDLTRAVDTPVVRGDASALRRDTGWEPEIPFDKTLDDVLADARARL